MAEKRCKDCGIVKPLDDFYRDNGASDGHRPCCKSCSAIRWRNYYEKHKDTLQQDWRDYYNDNREQRRLDANDRYKDDLEVSRRNGREKHNRNKEKRNKDSRLYHAKYRDRLNANRSEYEKTLPPEKRRKRKQRTSEYRAKRRKTDGVFRLCETFSRQIVDALKERDASKTQSSFRIVGYTKADLRLHIENLFLPGQTWDNHGQGVGKWHLDHIRPLASFHKDDYASPEELIREAFALSNLQPLWSNDNIVKQSNWNGRRWKLGTPVLIQDEHEANNLAI